MDNSSRETLFSSKDTSWTTPDDFYAELNKEFRFTLDPCATSENAKCDKFYTIEDDGLKQDWSGETVFCNPPYGKGISEWVEKCYTEGQKRGTTVVLLIPARVDTKYAHEFIHDKATDVRFVKGRLKFGEGKNSAPFPSMVVVYKSGIPSQKTELKRYKKIYEVMFNRIAELESYIDNMTGCLESTAGLINRLRNEEEEAKEDALAWLIGYTDCARRYEQQ